VVNDRSIEPILVIDRMEKFGDRQVSRGTFRMMINLMGSETHRSELLSMTFNIVTWVTDFLNTLRKPDLNTVEKLDDRVEAILLIPYLAVALRFLEYLKNARAEQNLLAQLQMQESLENSSIIKFAAVRALTVMYASVVLIANKDEELVTELFKPVNIQVL